MYNIVELYGAILVSYSESTMEILKRGAKKVQNKQ